MRADDESGLLVKLVLFSFALTLLAFGDAWVGSHTAHGKISTGMQLCRPEPRSTLGVGISYMCIVLLVLCPVLFQAPQKLTSVVVHAQPAVMPSTLIRERRSLQHPTNTVPCATEAELLALLASFEGQAFASPNKVCLSPMGGPTGRESSAVLEGVGDRMGKAD